MESFLSLREQTCLNSIFTYFSELMFGIIFVNRDTTG